MCSYALHFAVEHFDAEGCVQSQSMRYRAASWLRAPLTCAQHSRGYTLCHIAVKLHPAVTESRRRVRGIPWSYSGSPGFKPRPEWRVARFTHTHTHTKYTYIHTDNIVTGLRSGILKNYGSIPGRNNRCFSAERVQICSGVHTACYWMYASGYSPRCKLTEVTNLKS
jgi:hypothetical protein